MHRGMARLLGALAFLAVLSGVGVAEPATLDPAAVVFKLPEQIAWKNNASGNRTAVLQVDPAKPGPYAMLLQWLPGNMSRPHFHPNDRFFMVLSGTWWVGSGPTFNPEATVAMPAGSYVTHFAKGVHFDGAKNEQATILVWGEGPATAPRFPPQMPSDKPEASPVSCPGQRPATASPASRPPCPAIPLPYRSATATVPANRAWARPTRHDRPRPFSR